MKMSEEAKQLTAADITAQLKPLSENAFLRFFQKIWRWWLGVWYGFCDKHPKLSSVVYKVFFFIVFSEGVTIVQILILMFLPQLFGLELAAKEFMIPKVPIKLNDEFTYNWSFLGNEINYNKAGEVIIGGGLGYFLAFKIATFLAQVINFPLQRNITYRSHGNPWYQAMWYFIGWVLINLFCDAINNLWLPISNYYLPYEVSSILAMIAQGGIAMVIFFFIFMVIFPDNNKMAKKAKEKYEKLVAENAPAEKIEKAKAKMELWEDKALKSNTEKDYFKAKSQVNAKVMSYLAVVKNGEKANAKFDKLTAENAPAEKLEKAKAEKEAFPEKIQRYFDSAVEAIQTKDEKEKAFHEICGAPVAA